MTRTLFLLIFLSVFTHVKADLIDFETGFTTVQLVPSVTTATNVLNIATGNGSPTKTAFIADTGGTRTSFAGAGSDLSNNSSLQGSFFLNDENTTALIESLDYFFEFETPVFNLALDLYDMEVGTATLSVFSDVARTNLITSQTLGASGNGGILHLDVSDLAGGIISATVVHGSDAGVGLDNIEFDTNVTSVPEPKSYLFLMIALVLFSQFQQRK